MFRLYIQLPGCVYLTGVSNGFVDHLAGDIRVFTVLSVLLLHVCVMSTCLAAMSTVLFA